MRIRTPRPQSQPEVPSSLPPEIEHDAHQQGGTGAITTVDQLTAAVLRGICTTLFHCYSGNNDDLGLTAVFNTEARCQTVLASARSVLTGIYAEWLDAAARGEATVDPVQAASCVSWMSTHCEAARNVAVVDACRRAVVGTKNVGDACHTDSSCGPGLYCDQSAAACPGSCAARKSASSACSGDSECAAAPGGLANCAYDSTLGSMVCEAVTVVPGATLGQACGRVGSTGVICDPSLYCDNTGTTPTCQTPIPIGTACTSADQACVRPGYCTGPTGNETCQLLTLSQQTGTACGSLSTTTSQCDLVSGYICSASGTCALLGDGGQGTPCATGDASVIHPCDAGLYCESTTKTCTPKVAASGPCTSDAQCQSASCDDVSGLCRDRYCTEP